MSTRYQTGPGKTTGVEVTKTCFSALSLLPVLEPLSNKTPSNTTQPAVLPDAVGRVGGDVPGEPSCISGRQPYHAAHQTPFGP